MKVVYCIVNITATDGIHTVLCVLDLRVGEKPDEIGTEAPTGEQFVLNSAKNKMIAWNYHHEQEQQKLAHKADLSLSY